MWYYHRFKLFPVSSSEAFYKWSSLNFRLTLPPKLESRQSFLNAQVHVQAACSICENQFHHNYCKLDARRLIAGLKSQTSWFGFSSYRIGHKNLLLFDLANWLAMHCWLFAIHHVGTFYSPSLSAGHRLAVVRPQGAMRGKCEDCFCRRRKRTRG